MSNQNEQQSDNKSKLVTVGGAGAAAGTAIATAAGIASLPFAAVGAGIALFTLGIIEASKE